MMYIRYPLYFWTPPTLSPQREIETGRLIVLEGREKFLRRTAPFAATRAPSLGIRQASVLAVFVVLAFWFLAPFWAPLIIATAVIGGYSIGTLALSRYYYRRWVDQMIARYAASAASNAHVAEYGRKI